MNNLPLVTIAISSYNHEDYIEQSLTSVLEQTYPNIELVVIDDGSTDNTANIIQKLSEQHGFYFERQKNMGLTRTLNKALAMAKGKYFAALGSDDMIMSDKVEKQVVVMERDESIAVCGGGIIEINQDGVHAKKQSSHPYRELNFDDLLLNRKPGLPAPTLMLRADYFRNLGGYSTKVRLEDLYSQLLLANYGYKLVGLSDALSYYRVHPTNTYKNYRFMLDNVLHTFSFFKTTKNYDLAVNKFLTSMFVKVAKKDRQLAISIFKQIAKQYYSFRLLKGFFRLLTEAK